MKILIDNRTNLSNQDVGIIIDDLQEREKYSTQFYNKWKGYEFNFEDKGIYKIETLVLQRYFKVLIMEVKNDK